MNNDYKVKIFKMPRWMVLVGRVCLITFIITFIVVLVVDIPAGIIENALEAFGYFMMFSPYWGLCLYISINYDLWKVEMHQEYFIYRNWFGIKKTYRYEDLTFDETKAWSKTFFYKDEKKVFSMPYYVEGGDELRKKVKRVLKAKERRLEEQENN